MHTRTILCWLSLPALLSAAPGPSQAPPTPQPVFGDPGRLRDEPCAPFTTLRAGVIALFPKTVFSGAVGYNRKPLLALNDGGAMVAAGYGALFRIDPQSRVTMLWKETRNDYWMNNGIALLRRLTKAASFFTLQSGCLACVPTVPLRFVSRWISRTTTGVAIM